MASIKTLAMLAALGGALLLAASRGPAPSALQQQLWDFPYGGAPEAAQYPYSYPAGGYPDEYPLLPYRGEYPYSYPAYPGPYPYNGYPSNFVYQNRVGLDVGDGNRDGVYETYADNDHAFRDYTAREQYRQWEDAQERNEYDAFLRRNYFSTPSTGHAILHEDKGGPDADTDTGGERELSLSAKASADEDDEEQGRRSGNEWGIESAEGVGDRQLEEEDGETLWNVRGNK